MEAGERGKKASSSPVEKIGTSLFHRLLDRRMLLNPKEEMKFLLHRLIYVAYISTELADKRDLGGYYERLFQNLQRRYQGDGISGLLLLYPSYVVHMIESSSDILFSVLRDLRSMQEHGHRVLLVDPRILIMSHDIPNRLFQQWSYEVLNLPANTLTDRSHREPTLTLVSESLTRLLKLGTHLLKCPKSSKASQDNLVEKVPELLLPQDTIGDLLEREELLTPHRYLEAYDSPLNIVMDSGHVFGSANPTTV